MSIPSQPRELYEQAVSCVINGRQVNWTSCTMYSAAHGVDQATLGKQRPSGCALRRSIGDSSGGTTLTQAASAVDKLSATRMLVYVGDAAISFASIGDALHAGKGVVLQGNAGALLRSPFRSTGGYVNHAVFLSRGFGFEKNEAGHFIPSSVKVYDPAADGRSAAWGRAARGPDVWSWSLVKAFGAALRPWGDGDSRTLAKLRPGRAYAGVFPDTEPHVHLRYTGSKRTDPFPDAMTVRSPTTGKPINVRSGPSTKYPVKTTLATGKTFTAYQVNRAGQLLAGSRVWYGDHNGTRWVHSSGVR
jgi:hypothetical protein